MFGFVLFVKLVDYQLAVFLNINNILTLTLVNSLNTQLAAIL